MVGEKKVRKRWISLMCLINTRHTVALQELIRATALWRVPPRAFLKYLNIRQTGSLRYRKERIMRKLYWKHLKEWELMGKILRIKISIGILCCLMVVMSGCDKNSELTENNSITESQGIEGTYAHSDGTENSEKEAAEADLPLESETSESMNHNTDQEDRYTRYFCLEADDPEVQERIAGAEEDGFIGATFIMGLAGFSPESDPTGGILFYRRDREIIIEKNVGMGLLQTERLAEVKETIREMMMDIIRERGRNGSDYKEYFADEIMLQQIETFLSTEIEEDWLLLESFYLSWYAGNTESFYWSNKSEITWRDPENEVTERLTETDTMYLFGFSFYADYRTMECGEHDKAAEIYVDCAVSKETGCIEEISISKTYMDRHDFETMRWT